MSNRIPKLEQLERRDLLCGDDWCSGPWRLNATDNGDPDLPLTIIKFPDSTHTGSALEIYYEVEETHVPLSRVLLNDGFVRQTSESGPLTTSFRNFQYFTSDDEVRDKSVAETFCVVGVNAQNQLLVEATYQNDDFEVLASYVFDPPNAMATATIVSLETTNQSGADIVPAWDGHRALEEQWRLFGVSSMYVAHDYADGIPDWYTALDPQLEYVGIIQDADPMNDAYSKNGMIYVPAHDTARLLGDALDMALAHDTADLPPVEVPNYTWFEDFIFYRHESSWLGAEHAYDASRNHRVDLLNATGLVNGVAEMTWSARYDRDDTNMVDGDNLQITTGIDQFIDVWPAGASQTLQLRLVSGPVQRGDFNLDGLINATDIDLLYAAANEATHDPFFELTGDGLVNQLDVDEHVRNILNTEYGDANLDGRVNSSDAAILGGNFGTQTNASWSMGSFNGDGNVNSSDAAILGGNFGFPTVLGGGNAALARVVRRLLDS